MRRVPHDAPRYSRSASFPEGLVPEGIGLALLAPILILSFLIASPSSAWTMSCRALCDAATAFQGYGTGSDDTACLDACASGGSRCWNAEREELWSLYFECVDGGNPIESCRDAYSEAKECSVCSQGDTGSWNPADVLFVNGAACNPNPSYQASGAYNDPLCRFEQGIDGAITRQKNGQDTKVIVCDGTYRESYDKIYGIDAVAPGSAKVVVEAAVAGNAVISGSEDWSGAWMAQPQTVQETIHNELIRSNQLQGNAWATGNINLAPVWVNDPPTFALPGPTKVYGISAALNALATDAMILEQEIPLLTDRLATLSIYIRPGTATRFMLDYRISNTESTWTGAWYAFDLPSSTCSNDKSAGAAGVGIEDAGNGWFRVHLTQSVDTDPTTGKPPNGVLKARFHLMGPLQQGEGAQIFAPQLDHRPLDQFETTPRTYVQTVAVPAQLQVSANKPLFANNVFQRAWTHDWGLARHHELWGELPPLMRHSEMIFVDGQPLRQELSITDMEPGSFYVDDGIPYGGYNYKHTDKWIPGQCSAWNPCPILIYPPTGVVLNEALVEVAVAPRLLWLNGVRDWDVRGLHFQHSSGAYDSSLQQDCPANPNDCTYPLNNSAVSLVNAGNLTLLENRFDWNNSFGVGVSGLGPNNTGGIVLRRNMANDNGVGGEFLGQTWGFIVDQEEFSRNNWRGRRVGVLGHTTTGAKYSAVAEGTIRKIIANDNHGSGLWFDYDNQAVTVSESLFMNNAGAGIYFEGNDEWTVPSTDPTSFVIENWIEGNGTGVQGISSRDVRIDSNTLTGNDVAIGLIGTPRPHPQGGPTRYLRDWYITSNRLDATCPHQLWFQYGDERANNDYTSDWQPVMQSLLSDYNDFSHAAGSSAPGFVIKADPPFTLKTWQTCTLTSDPWCFLPQDANSQFVP